MHKHQIGGTGRWLMGRKRIGKKKVERWGMFKEGTVLTTLNKRVRYQYESNYWSFDSEIGEETYVPKVLYSEGPMFRTFVKMLGT